MKKALEFVKNFRNPLIFLETQRGAAAVEYGIMVALIAAVIVVAVTSIGTKVNAAFLKVVSALP